MRSLLAALGVAGTTAVLVVAGTVLILLNWPLPLEIAEWGFPGFQGLAALVFGGVGLAVAIRRAANPIGWLLLTGGLLSAIQFVGHQYALYGLVRAPGAVPEPSLGTWIEEWIWVPIIACIGTYTFLLFPTGRLASPGWRPLAWLGAIATALGTTGALFLPPVRVPGATNPLTRGDAATEPAALAGIALVLPMLAYVGAMASLVVRFRRSAGLERQQLKWLAFGALLIVTVLAGFVVSVALTGDAHGPMAAVFALSTFAVPTTIAFAMLRYQLYEVDRLINRTVVYGLASVVLGACYAGSVLVLQAVLAPVTGGDTLAVAVSTLLVAAIFQRVRARIQRAVDRRFNRFRYDAEQTVRAFAARLRDELDLDSLTTALVRSSADSVAPSSVGVWLRSRGGRR